MLLVHIKDHESYINCSFQRYFFSRAYVIVREGEHHYCCCDYFVADIKVARNIN